MVTQKEVLDPEARLQRLLGEVEEARSTLQRVQADFINYKRRADQEREELHRYLNAALITRLLPVLDDLGRALEHAPSESQDDAWNEGVRLINRKLHALLESEGVSPIEAEGKEFSPLEHEAVAFLESTNHRDGSVMEVVRPGYRHNGRVLRAVQVVVARAPQTDVEI